MKFLVLVFVQLLIVHTAWSTVSQGGNFSNPEYPGMCYYGRGNEPPTIISPGEEVTIKGKCISALCHGDFSMRLESCMPVSGPNGRYTEANHSRPYPECCPGYDPPKNE